MDQDISAVAKRLEGLASSEPPPERVRLAIQEALGRPPRRSASCRHTPAARFRPGQPLALEVSVEKSVQPTSVRLYYRRVNQAELWRSEEMTARGDTSRVEIAGEYTSSPFPLQYYFELRERPDSALLWPGFDADLSNQPYFVVRQR